MVHIRKLNTEKPGSVLLLFLLLFGLLAAAFAVSLLCGSVQISLKEALEAYTRGDQTNISFRILAYVRLPRALAALLSGAALAAAGVILQNVLNNALAAPNIIGINAGAGFAALVAAAILPAQSGMLPGAAFCGALLASCIIYAIASVTRASRTTITLTGVAVSSLFTACSNGIRTFFPDSVYNASSFFIGGFSDVSYPDLFPAWIWILAGLVPAFLLAGRMDVLSLGDETAHSLGLSVRSTRFILLMLASLLAGSAVSFSGLLGFVGLIVPHIFRHLVGTRHRLLLPLSVFGGSIFVLLCDTLSRTLFAPYEIPVGIVLSVLGCPFFLFLILTKKGGRLE